MTWKLVSAVTLGAALLASAAAQAAPCKRDADCPEGQVCSAGTCRRRPAEASEIAAGTNRTPYIAWGGLGIYNVPANTYFGFHVGAAANLIQITPELPLIGWADAALTIGSDLYFPLAAGAGVRYDRAGPFQLLGGAGFALLPHTGAGTTPVGLRLMGTVLYPLPMLDRNLTAQGQISYDFLSESSHLFAVSVGIGYPL
jgi:Cys-rich repeat protein